MLYFIPVIIFSTPFVASLCALAVLNYRHYIMFSRLYPKPLGFRQRLTYVCLYLLGPVPVISTFSFSMVAGFMFLLYFALLEVETQNQETNVNIAALDWWLVQNHCDTSNPSALIESRVFKCEGDDWCRPKQEGGLHWECESGITYRWSE